MAKMLKFLRKKNFLHDFLDKKFNLIQFLMIVSAILGLSLLFERVVRINILQPLGFIFLTVGIYGLIRLIILKNGNKKHN